MAKLHFRFIISPENQNVDLEQLVHDFVEQIEFKTGHKLDWVAANHYNTGKQHAHLLVNGFDLNRKRVFFQKSDISTVFRETLRDLCTAQVGYRSFAERELAALRQTVSNSFTNLDRRLESMADEDNGVSFYRLCHLSDDSLLHRRMMHLKALDLARYDLARDEFILDRQWKEKLKMYSMYNTYLEGLKYTCAHPSDYSLHEVGTWGLFPEGLFINTSCRTIPITTPLFWKPGRASLPTSPLTKRRS